jgi:hypothetical protein
LQLCFVIQVEENDAPSTLICFATGSVSYEKEKYIFQLNVIELGAQPGNVLLIISNTFYNFSKISIFSASLNFIIYLFIHQQESLVLERSKLTLGLATGQASLWHCRFSNSITKYSCSQI